MTDKLPPELRAMNEAMNMVFNAVTNAAPQAPEHASPQNAKAANPASHGVGNPAGAAPDFAPRRMDIETEIMRAPGFDYLLASEIFAALQRRLELRYENLNPQVEEAMQRLAKSFDHVTG